MCAQPRDHTPRSDVTTIVPAPERPLLPRGLVILLTLAAATIVLAGMKAPAG